MKSRIRQRSFSGMPSNVLLGGTSSTYIFLILAAFIFIFGLIKPQAISSLRVATTDIFSPALSAVARPFQKMASAVTNISDIAELRAENRQLKTENARLKEWYQTALMLEAENQSLQKILNIKIDSNYNYITARTLSDASNAFVKTILISSGKNDGIATNQAVLSGEGMVGRVIETGTRTARILLITDINSRIPILIEGSQQKAVMVGNNSDFPTLKYILSDSSLQLGARVVTSGDGGVFPVGLPIGRLVKNDKGYVVIQPFTDMNNITYVRSIDKQSNHYLDQGLAPDLLN